MVSAVETHRCLDCRFCGKKGGDRYCIHPFIKKRNHRTREMFLLSDEDVYIFTKCTMSERRK
jgi:hypothetical protein